MKKMKSKLAIALIIIGGMFVHQAIVEPPTRTRDWKLVL